MNAGFFFSRHVLSYFPADPDPVVNGSVTGDRESLTLNFSRPVGVYDSFLVLITSPSNPNFPTRRQEIEANSTDSNDTVSVFYLMNFEEFFVCTDFNFFFPKC